MRLIFGRRARADLQTIHAYIACDSARSADAVLLQLVEACEGLADFPAQGRPAAVEGLRELVTVPPYVVTYTVADDRIEIVRIRHGAQDRRR